MAKFLVSYDLRKPNYTEQDYENLWDALKGLRAKRIQDSVWGLQTELNAKALIAKLQPHIHARDRLLVANISDWNSIQGINRIADL
jgi:CRISPR associated protein Cas2